MNPDASSLYSLIRGFSADEPAFSRYTSPLLWNDPWISTQMLKAHLDPDADVASRKPGFINESAEFLRHRFAIGPGTRVVDFGCGPGLYTSRLARFGARVAGIDLSESSLAYARKQAEEEGLSIDYILGDYLDVPVPGQADLAIMIYYDFGALGPERRRTLLKRVRASLTPGGFFFFDVFSFARLESQVEEKTWSFEESGFFGPRPYALFFERRKYPAESAFLEKFCRADEFGITEFHAWNACFSAESLTEELASSGFEVMNLYGDARGRPLAGGSDTIAACARSCQPGATFGRATG